MARAWCWLRQPWVAAVGTHGHQRVGIRSADCWVPETAGAMHCNEAAVALLWQRCRVEGQDAAVWCPLSPHCPCSPATRALTRRDRLFVPTSHISVTLPEPLLLPTKVAKLHNAKATQTKPNLHNAKPTQPPSLHPGTAVDERTN